MDAEEANKFINSLVKNLQVLCHGHVNFNNSIQVIGHLYLNVDSQTNIDYIVNEKVCKNDTSSTVFVSNSYHSEQPQKKNSKQDNGISQNDKNKQIPQSDIEASVDLTDDGSIPSVVPKIVPITFGSSVDPPTSSIHPAYRDQGPTPTYQSTPHHHSRKSRKPFHNIEARSPPAKSPRLSITPIHRTLLNRNNDSGSKHDRTSSYNSSQLNLGSDSVFANSNIPDTSLIDNNVVSPSQNDDSEFEPSVRNIKSEPHDDPDENSGLFDQQMGSNASQLAQHSDASADEEFFSGLRDKTLGVFPIALHASDQVMGPDNFSSLSQPSTSTIKNEMGDLDPGMAGNLDSTLNVKFDNQTGGLSCPHCGATYDKRNSLYRHIQDKHGNRIMHCDVCGASFNRKANLVRHVNQVHQNKQSTSHKMTFTGSLGQM